MHIYLPIAGVAVNALTIIGAGGAVGFLSGLFGVGGGFIITPLLLFLGIPTAVAIASGANQATATAVSGAMAHWQRGNIDFRMGLLLLSGGIAGSLVGTQLVGLLRSLGQFELFVSLSYVVLLGSIGSLMLVESLGTILRSSRRTTTAEIRRRHSWAHGLPFKMRFPRSRLYISAIPVVAIGIAVGVLTALMGVGGGFVLVPAMVYVLRMRTSIAVGTSLYQIMFVGGFTTLIQAVALQSVDVVLSALLMVAGVVGTQFGAKAGARLRGEQLRALLAILVIAVCIRVAVDLVRTPGDVFSLSMDRRPRILTDGSPAASPPAGGPPKAALTDQSPRTSAIPPER
ncbi:MAG: sulfite exporter TauE/SafE family protein [Hyphomicrobiaceae bacterium]|nr:sulfite exporter TauE/SafE family protein [Hyphomicrobiaceae bacterium]